MKKQPDDAALGRYSQEHSRCLGLVARELRTERGLTQHEVAKRANVSLRWVQRLEDNQLNTNYSIGRLYQVARALEVELYDLYKRVDEMAGPAPWLKA
jgi:transcriptional regulator with XRE-family HTH domain